jgi:hypothetical protein
MAQTRAPNRIAARPRRPHAVNQRAQTYAYFAPASALTYEIPALTADEGAGFTDLGIRTLPRAPPLGPVIIDMTTFGK